MAAVTDQVINLQDGRQLGYANFGDPSGAPVLNCHGGLVSRNDVAPCDADARELGLRIISPDRPGTGLSDRAPRLGILPWAETDVPQLLDALGLVRVGVMGWSEGAQYALALGAAIPERVTHIAMIAGTPPLDDPVTLARLNRLDRWLAVLATRAPTLASVYFGLTHLVAATTPGLVVKMMERACLPEEAAAIEAQGTWGARILAEGSSNARGAVDGYQAMVAPWGFTPEDIRVPVTIFQGTHDWLVPEDLAHELAERIHGATMIVFPGEGHMIGLTRRREVLSHLAQTLPAVSPRP